jgi:hypothetical protein
MGQGCIHHVRLMGSGFRCEYPCSTFCLSNAYPGHASQPRRTCEVLPFVQPSCPKISDTDQLVQLSCSSRANACATHTTCPLHSRIRALTAGGCDPPSLSLFLNLNQHLPACHLSALAPTPGSLLHTFARQGENRRQCVYKKVALSSEETIGQDISSVSCRAASLPVIGYAEGRIIHGEESQVQI